MNKIFLYIFNYLHTEFALRRQPEKKNATCTIYIGLKEAKEENSNSDFGVQPTDMYIGFHFRPYTNSFSEK